MLEVQLPELDVRTVTLCNVITALGNLACSYCLVILLHLYVQINVITQFVQVNNGKYQ